MKKNITTAIIFVIGFCCGLSAMLFVFWGFDFFQNNADGIFVRFITLIVAVAAGSLSAVGRYLE